MTFRSQAKRTGKEMAYGTAWLAWAAAAVVGIVILAFTVYWPLHTRAVNREDRLRRDRFEFQQTYRANISRHIADLAAIDVQLTARDADPASLNAQRAAIVRLICADASQLNEPLGGPDAATIAKECS